MLYVKMRKGVITPANSPNASGNVSFVAFCCVWILWVLTVSFFSGLKLVKKKKKSHDSEAVYLLEITCRRARLDILVTNELKQTDDSLWFC